MRLVGAAGRRRARRARRAGDERAVAADTHLELLDSVQDERCKGLSERERRERDARAIRQRLRHANAAGAVCVVLVELVAVEPPHVHSDRQ